MIEELYHETIKHNHYSLKLLIEYLVNERKILKMTDSEDKLTYYLQDRFAVQMNQYLADYEVKRNEHQL
jgi:hypothetical protein